MGPKKGKTRINYKDGYVVKSVVKYSRTAGDSIRRHKKNTVLNSRLGNDQEINENGAKFLYGNWWYESSLLKLVKFK